MRGIDINIICTVLLKYERVGSEEQEIILVWPNEDMIFFYHTSSMGQINIPIG